MSAMPLHGMPDAVEEWKFVVPAKRAAPIPTQAWERHKELICQMFPNHTLDYIAAFMEREHGFSAK
jgi:hypothetical protein